MRRKRWALIAVLTLALILIVSSSSSAEEIGNFRSPSHWSQARNARVMTSFHARASRPSPSSSSSTSQLGNNRSRPPEDIYGEEKRVVHTGPNPLHN